ncbi:MAG: DUF3990 domain-containing protein [Kiritimatiellaeota bacterium]|nr:DUF3990 domain-containing protein [Kiritimatiellota bacterium]
MTLWHGSYTVVEKPDLSFSRLRTDFGKGFYLTPLKAQAVRWAKRFLNERGSALLSSYEFVLDPVGKIPSKIKTLHFESHTEAWFDFILACRKGKSRGPKWDLVIGGVANDNVFNTIQLHQNKIISKEEAIKRLIYQKPNIQYCFKSQRVIDGWLKFKNSEALK